MEFPSWTPQWVRDEFVQLSQSEDWIEDPHDSESKDLIATVIQSPESRMIWESLGRMPAKGNNRVAELASFVWAAHWGFGHNAIKKAEKAKIARDARRHAEALIACLSKLTTQDYFALNSIVGSFADISMTRRMPEAVNDFHMIWNDDPDAATFVPQDTIRRAAPAIHRIASNAISECLYSDAAYHLLGGLCGSLDKWADRQHEVTKPDHKNAKRLYFIRAISHDFNANYGRPLRKETLALASVFFDCSDLDEAAISRLAPVRIRATSTE